MELLTQYIIALTNLYGIVHRAKVVEIYNNQSDEKVKLSDIREVIKKDSHELESNFVQVHREYFVNSGIEGNNEFNQLLMEKEGKPYYVPVKEELLKYVDDFYFEKNDEYNELIKYVTKNFNITDSLRVDNICVDIQSLLQFGGNIRSVFELLDDYRIDFNDDEQMNEFLLVIMNLTNNMRIWENNGYTPLELNEIYNKEKQGAVLRH